MSLIRYEDLTLEQAHALMREDAPGFSGCLNRDENGNADITRYSDSKDPAFICFDGNLTLQQLHALTRIMEEEEKKHESS